MFIIRKNHLSEPDWKSLTNAEYRRYENAELLDIPYIPKWTATAYKRARDKNDFWGLAMSDRQWLDIIGEWKIIIQDELLSPEAVRFIRRKWNDYCDLAEQTELNKKQQRHINRLRRFITWMNDYA